MNQTLYIALMPSYKAGNLGSPALDRTTITRAIASSLFMIHDNVQDMGYSEKYQRKRNPASQKYYDQAIAMIIDTLGIDVNTARNLDALHVNQRRVPPDIIDKHIVGGSSFNKDVLTKHMRKIPGLDTAIVRNMKSHPEGDIVIDVPTKTSRTALVGKDGNKYRIKMYNYAQRQIIVPESMLHAALGICESPSSSSVDTATLSLP